MARLIYAIDGDLTGLANVVNQAIGLIKQLDTQSGKIKFGSEGLQSLPATLATISSGLQQVKTSADSANVSLSFKKGVDALDQLGAKLSVIRGNAELFGASLRDQQAELNANQVALDKLLSLGYEPLNADVLLLKGNIDALTASIAAQNAVTVKAPQSTIVDKTQFTEPVVDTGGNIERSVTGTQVLIRELDKDLAAGKISAQEYATAISFIGQQTTSTNVKLEQEVGILQGLNTELSLLKKQKPTIFDPADLAKQNARIQELEAEIARFGNVGKVGFDSTGVAVKNFGKELENSRTPLENVGKGLTRSFGYLRQLAFILPGIGIAGIFNLAFIGIEKAAEALELFSNKLSVAEKNLANLNAVAVAAGKQFGEQATNLRILYQATTDVTNSEKDRVLAARELQKEFPDTFRNIKLETILNGGASDSYKQLTADILDNAKARAALTKIQELAGKQLEDDIKIQKIAIAFANENAKVKPVIQTAGGAGGGSDVSGPRFTNAAQQAQSIKDQKENNRRRAQLAVDEARQDKKDLQAQIDFLTAFAGGNNKIAKSLALKDTPKDKTGLEDVFARLSNQLDALIAKSNALGASTGLTGYAAEVQKIASEFGNINTALDQLQAKTNRDLNRGKITSTQASTLTNKIQGAQSQIGINEQRALDAALVAERQKFNTDLQSIDDAFGVKQEQSRRAELAAVQKLANDKIAVVSKGIFTQQQIEDQFNASVSAAKGNKDQIATATKVRDAEILAAQESAIERERINSGVLSAQDAINQKYLTKERELQDSIASLRDVALEDLSNKETNATNKIVAGWDKRKVEAAKYFDQLRTIYPELSAIITKQQQSTNALFDAAKFRDVSVELSKNFATAMQAGVNTLAQDFFTQITGLGAARQAIDDKYRDQYAQATDALTKQQIAQQEQIEKSATTSFGAIFSSLISSSFASFNKSILDSLTKRFTENLGTTLIKPNADQLGLKVSGQQFSSTVVNAGESFRAQIDAAAQAIAVRVNPALLNGASGGAALAGNNELAASSAGGQVAGSIATAGADFNQEVTSAGASVGSALNEGAASAAATTTTAASTAGATIKTAGAGLSAKIATAAAGLSVLGGLISGATSPTSSVGQGIGGALSGAGTGALIGTAIAPGIGTAVGAVLGGVIGGISGLFSASKAKKQEELQQKQLEQQQETNALLARQNALAYTSSIIGRMTTQGIITGADISAFGELTAKISGKDVQFVLSRNSNGR